MLRNLTTPAGLALLVMATVAALAAPGCAAEDPAAHPRVCGGDGDCAAGLVCSFDFCTVSEPTALPLRARIFPPAALGLLQQQLPDLDLDPVQGNTITLRRPVVVVGRIRNEDDVFSTNLAGELEARTAGDIPGLDYRFTARSLDGLDDFGHGYTLRLLEGRDYQVTFRPDNRDTPPYSFTLSAEEVVRGGCDEHPSKANTADPPVQHDVCADITLPKRADYIRFQRFVRLGSAEQAPVAGARVSVELSDGRALPEVTTDSEKGSFDVTLPPDATSVRVRITAPSTGLLFPDFESEWLDASPTDGVTAITIPALPPNLKEFEAAVTVLAPVDGGQPAPVSGLSLSMFGHLEGGTLRRAATTDADGVARFSALPGAYEILVEVPPGQAYGARRVKLTLDAPAIRGDGPVVITLEPRILLGGPVRDAANRTVKAGSVIATLRPEKDANDSLSVATAPFQAPIGSDGRFEMLVDPGTYDLRVLPETYTGAPALRLAGVSVTSLTELLVALPAPTLTHLQVVDPDGIPIPSAIVELFTDDGPVADEAPVPSLLVKATTGSRGTVDLLVPFAP
ncbi:MAG: hypothetical protein R3F39_17460 [Myxococcota bacterium]